MRIISCYVPTCSNKSEASCNCTSPPTFSCNEHVIQHCQSSIQPHNFTSLFSTPVEDTKEAILNFLIEQKSKIDATKVKVLTSFCQAISNLEKAFKEILKEIDNDSTNFICYFDKVREIKRVSHFEKDPVSSLLTLQSHEAIQRAKEILVKNYNFKSINNMITLIDQAISNYNEEKWKAFKNEKLLNLENTENSFEKEAIFMHQANFKPEEVITENPNNDIANNSLGDIFYKEGKYEEAIKYYNDAISIDKNCALYYRNKGEVLEKLGRNEEAIECYIEAIKINPDQDISYNSIGDILRSQKRYEEAIIYYTDAIEINPNSSIYYANKGDALFNLDELEEAMDCLKTAIRINPNNSTALAILWNIYYKKKKYVKAIKYYDNVIRINPKSPDCYIMKGNALRLLDRIKEAKECYQNAITIDKNQDAAYAAIGDILNIEEDEFEEAIEYYNEAIRINPNEWVYFKNKGDALRNLGRTEEALECSKEFSRLFKARK